MTTVKYTQDGKKHYVDINGHAEYNPGCDIVCSAVSVLAYTLLQTIQHEEQQGNLEIREMSVLSGGVVIVFREHYEAHDRINGIMNAFMTGYEMLSEQYPDNVSIEW